MVREIDERNMDINLTGKKALVTGAGKGIGRAIAKTLAQSGVKTYAVSRTQVDLDSLQQEVPDIHTILLDLSDWEKTKEVLSGVEAVDFLINNAAVLIVKPFQDISKEELDTLFDINFKAMFNVSQIFAKKMIDAEKPGSIVNISSVGSKFTGPGYNIYCCSKAAVDMLTKCMALELGCYKIRVNCVNPFLVWTPMTLQFKDVIESSDFLSRIPLGKTLEAEDVVHTVIFLLSDKSGMITGETICVDGGRCVS